MDLYAPPWQAFALITLPLMAPALVSGWLLAFTLSLDDVVVASFTSGPGALDPADGGVLLDQARPDAGTLRAGHGHRRGGGRRPAGRVAGAARICGDNDCPPAAAPIGSAPALIRDSAMHLTAERLDRIQPSLTIAIATKARHMIAEGKNVISLSQGEPDFDTPRNVKDAAIRAIEANETHYTDVAGTPELRRRWRQKFKRDSGIDYKPEEIIISTGGKQVIFNAMLATLNEGRRGDHPEPVLGELSRHRLAGRRQAGAGAVRAEPRLQAARRGAGSRRSRRAPGGSC